MFGFLLRKLGFALLLDHTRVNAVAAWIGPLVAHLPKQRLILLLNRRGARVTSYFGKTTLQNMKATSERKPVRI